MPEEWTKRYEALRRHAVQERRLLEGGWGLALLVHGGVAAWMRAWPKPEAMPVSCPDSLRNDQAEYQPAASLSRQMTAVWVNILLSRRAIQQTYQRKHWGVS